LLQLQVVPTILIQAVRTEQVAANLSSLTCYNLILQSICNKNKMASSFLPVIQTSKFLYQTKTRGFAKHEETLSFI
jgi:uncharacterized protein YpbB